MKNLVLIPSLFLVCGLAALLLFAVVQEIVLALDEWRRRRRVPIEAMKDD